MENKNSMKRTFPADAANIFVRNLLCDMSEELGGFKEHDWKKRSNTLIKDVHIQVRNYLRRRL